jgi:glutathione peroxidase
MRILRRLAALAIAPFAAACGAITTTDVEKNETQASTSFYTLEARALDGSAVPLERYRGQVTLVVNTASKCGLTPQYEGLEALQAEYGARGFTVLGFPSGDFGGQEFGSADEIREFCDSKYNVTFPLFEKSGVKAGPQQSPVFAFLGAATGSLPGWNFGKYLVDRDGKVLAFFAPPTDPTGAEIKGAIEKALAAG